MSPSPSLPPFTPPTAIDLLSKMLTFDPATRISVPEALEHPWLASYHDVADEPECPVKFEKWRELEELETLDEFREAIWREIEDYRREVRGVNDLDGRPIHIGRARGSASGSRVKEEREAKGERDGRREGMGDEIIEENEKESDQDNDVVASPVDDFNTKEDERRQRSQSLVSTAPTDPVVTYARRSSILQPARQGSTYNSPLPSHQHLPSYTESPLHSEPHTQFPSGLPPGPSAGGGQGSVAFPTQGYVFPARSRTGSTAGGEVAARRLLRTLSTVSIHESAEGLAGGLAGIAPIGRFIVGGETTGADAPASEMPRDFGIEEEEGEGEILEIKKGKFHVP